MASVMRPRRMVLIGQILSTAAAVGAIVGLALSQVSSDARQAHGIRGEFTVLFCEGGDPPADDYTCTGDFRADRGSLRLATVSMSTHDSIPAGASRPGTVAGPHATTVMPQFNVAFDWTWDALLAVPLVVLAGVFWYLPVHRRRRE